MPAEGKMEIIKVSTSLSAGMEARRYAISLNIYI